jgi:AhpD family alkylhydroperoxidase
MRLDYIKESPGGVKAFGDLYGYILESGLEDILIDLVYLRVSQINDCVYCLDIHTRALIKKNVTPAKRPLVQAWREAELMSIDRELAALAWAESVTLVADTHVPHDAFNAVAAASSEKELADLTVAISLITPLTAQPSASVAPLTLCCQQKADAGAIKYRAKKQSNAPARRYFSNTLQDDARLPAFKFPERIKDDKRRTASGFS